LGRQEKRNRRKIAHLSSATLITVNINVLKVLLKDKNNELRKTLKNNE
jgi:hypothetical protein